VSVFKIELAGGDCMNGSPMNGFDEGGVIVGARMDWNPE